MSAQGVSAQGVCELRGGVWPGGGVSAQGSVCLKECLPKGGVFLGGVCPWGCLSEIPHVDRMTDRCKNMLFNS